MDLRGSNRMNIVYDCTPDQDRNFQSPLPPPVASPSPPPSLKSVAFWYQE